MDNLVNSLSITVIGMGLVFIALILLWGGMVLLLRLIKDPVEKESLSSSSAAGETAESNMIEQKRMAAAIAVAMALARDQEKGIHEFPLPPTSIVSAWQAVMRSKNLSARRQTR